MLATIIPVLAALGGSECCSNPAPIPRRAACCGAADDRAATDRADDKGDLVVMELELLALDLNTCDRCTNTDGAMEAVVAELRPVLAEAGVELRFQRTVVKTAEQAVALRFESSPTVRINGRDIPIEFRESRCGDCTTLCGGTANTDCRVWVWRGREFTAAPKGLIVDAILRAYAAVDEAAVPASKAYSLPENLRQFFDARRQRMVVAKGTAPGSSSPGCCDTSSCCEASAKAQCCGSDSLKEKGTCGCKPQGTAN